MKWLLVLVLILCLSVVSVYIFIPSHLVISKMAVIHCTRNGGYRYVSEAKQWTTNWGEKNASKNDPNADSYLLTRKLSNGAEILIGHDGMQVPSVIQLFAKAPDSVVINWHCQLESGNNPIMRIRQYGLAVDLKKNMSASVKKMQVFLENPDNIYRFSITMASTNDSFLITTKQVSRQYPSTTEIYQMIRRLQEYIKSKDALETGKPMLNISDINAGNIQVMAGIPVNKPLPASGTILPKRLAPADRFMVTEVKGGPFAINEAMAQLRLYFEDYGKTLMAIPFQSLVTDRSVVTDTSKWITKIYVPVMN